MTVWEEEPELVLWVLLDELSGLCFFNTDAQTESVDVMFVRVHCLAHGTR